MITLLLFTMHWKTLSRPPFPVRNEMTKRFVIVTFTPCDQLILSSLVTLDIIFECWMNKFGMVFRELLPPLTLGISPQHHSNSISTRFTSINRFFMCSIKVQVSRCTQLFHPILYPHTYQQYLLPPPVQCFSNYARAVPTCTPFTPLRSI